MHDGVISFQIVIVEHAAVTKASVQYLLHLLEVARFNFESRWLRPRHRLKRPVPGKWRALFDPASDQPYLIRRQRILVLCRRHQIVITGIGGDAKVDLALLRLARRDPDIPAKVSKSAFLGVETIIRVPFLRIRPVAGETLRGENRTDIAIEFEWLRFRSVRKADRKGEDDGENC